MSDNDDDDDMGELEVFLEAIDTYDDPPVEGEPAPAPTALPQQPRNVAVPLPQQQRPAYTAVDGASYYNLASLIVGVYAHAVEGVSLASDIFDDRRQQLCV
jgi:hypothetical protein